MIESHIIGGEGRVPNTQIQLLFYNDQLIDAELFRDKEKNERRKNDSFSAGSPVGYN